MAVTPTGDNNNDNDDSNDKEQDALFVKADDGTLRLLHDTQRTRKGRDGKTRVVEADGTGGPVVIKARVPHDQATSSDKRYFVAGTSRSEPTDGLTVR